MGGLGNIGAGISVEAIKTGAVQEHMAREARFRVIREHKRYKRDRTILFFVWIGTVILAAVLLVVT